MFTYRHLFSPRLHFPWGIYLYFVFLFNYFVPTQSRPRQEDQIETPQENDVDAGRDHVRQTVADGTAGHGHDRRQGAQGPADGRRIADHIQTHVAQEV